MPGGPFPTLRIPNPNQPPLPNPGPNPNWVGFLTVPPGAGFLAPTPTLSSYGFQSDLYQLYATGDFVTHSLPVLAFSSLANIGIVTLQLYWATLILKGVRKLLAGGDGGKKGGKKSGKAA